MNNSTDKRNFFRNISKSLREYYKNIRNYLEEHYKPLDLFISVLTMFILGITAVILYRQLPAIQQSNLLVRDANLLVRDANILEIVQDLNEKRYQLTNQMDGQIWQYLYDKPESDTECTIDKIFPFDKRPSDPVSNPHETCLLKQRYLFNAFNYYHQIYIHYKEHRIDREKKYTTVWELTLQEEMRAACTSTNNSTKLQEMFNLYIPDMKTDFYSIQDMKTDFENWRCIPKTSD